LRRSSPRTDEEVVARRLELALVLEGVGFAALMDTREPVTGGNDDQGSRGSTAKPR